MNMVHTVYTVKSSIPVFQLASFILCRQLLLSVSCIFSLRYPVLGFLVFVCVRVLGLNSGPPHARQALYTLNHDPIPFVFIFLLR
jgi:hypothetical protein